MVLRFPRFGYQPTEGADGASRRGWRTGFWRRAPISGVLALITGILCAIATIAVLKASDGLPINHWRVGGYNVQPTVLLSVFATLANALFRYALTEGAKISWWVHAQQGTSIGALHRSWDHAQSALPIATAGRDITFNAVASFFVVLLLIDGPLFQRASSVGVVTRHNTTELVVPISSSPFMAGATGIYADHDYQSDPTLMNPLFSKILQHYNNRDPIVLPEFGCKGRCELQIIAPGWDIECDSWTSPYQLMTSGDFIKWENASYNNESYSGPADMQTVFWSNITYDTAAGSMYYELQKYRTGSYPPGALDDEGYLTNPFPFNTILLSSMIKSTPGDHGNFDWRYCILREAVQTYSISVTNKTVTIPRRNLGEDRTIYKVRRQPESSGQMTWPSTVGGLWLSSFNAFSGSASMDYAGDWSSVRTNSSSALVYLDIDTYLTLDTEDVKWSDPIDDMIAMIEELSLRTAIVTTSVPPLAPSYYVPEAPDLSKTAKEPTAKSALVATQPYIYSPNLTLVNRTLSQTVNTTMHYEETVYQSHYDWMFGALAVLVVALCSILPTFDGWWHLGRTVSMSPIETAKAFDAPLLRQADPNGTADDIAVHFRSVNVQYGASLPLLGEDWRSSIERLKGSSNVRVSGNGDDSWPRSRLHFGIEGTVAQPQYGQTFEAVRPELLVDYRRTSSI